MSYLAPSLLLSRRGEPDDGTLGPTGISNNGIRRGIPDDGTEGPSDTGRRNKRQPVNTGSRMRISPGGGGGIRRGRQHDEEENDDGFRPPMGAPRRKSHGSFNNKDNNTNNRTPPRRRRSDPEYDNDDQEQPLQANPRRLSADYKSNNSPKQQQQNGRRNKRNNDVAAVDDDLHEMKLKAYNNAAKVKANMKRKDDDDKELQEMKLKAYSNAARVKASGKYNSNIQEEEEEIIDLEKEKQREVDSELRDMKLAAYKNTARVKAQNRYDQAVEEQSEELKRNRRNSKQNKHQQRHEEEQAAKMKTYASSSAAAKKGFDDELDEDDAKKKAEANSGNNSGGEQQAARMVVRQLPKVALVGAGQVSQFGKQRYPSGAKTVDGPGAVAVQGVDANEEDDDGKDYGYDPTMPSTSFDEEKGSAPLKSSTDSFTVMTAPVTSAATKSSDEERSSISFSPHDVEMSSSSFAAINNSGDINSSAFYKNSGTTTDMTSTMSRTGGAGTDDNRSSGTSLNLLALQDGQASEPSREIIFLDNNGGGKKRQRYLLPVIVFLVLLLGIIAVVMLFLHKNKGNNSNAVNGNDYTNGVGGDVTIRIPTTSPTTAAPTATVSLQPSVSPLIWSNAGRIQGELVGSDGMYFMGFDTLVTSQNSTTRVHQLLSSSSEATSSGNVWSPVGDTFDSYTENSTPEIHVSKTGNRMFVFRRGYNGNSASVEAYTFSLKTGTWSQLGRGGNIFDSRRFSPQKMAVSGDGSRIFLSAITSSTIAEGQIYEYHRGAWRQYGNDIRITANFANVEDKLGTTISDSGRYVGMGFQDYFTANVGFTRIYKAPTSVAGMWNTVLAAYRNYPGGPAVGISEDEDIVVTAGNGLVKAYRLDNGQQLGPEIRYATLLGGETGDFAIPSLVLTSFKTAMENRIQIAFTYENSFRVFDLVGENRWESREINFVDAENSLKCDTGVTSLAYSPSIEDGEGENTQIRRLAIACPNDNKIQIIQTEYP